MRRLAKWTFCTLAIALSVFACGDITTSSSIVQPLNVCPAHSCSAYVQAGPSLDCVNGCAISSITPCESFCAPHDTSLAFTLVIDLPQSSEFAAGASFVLDPPDLIAATGHLSNCGTESCVQLPALAKEEGSLVVDYADAVKANFYLGNDASFATTLPVGLTVRPEVATDSTDTVFQDAALSGFALQAPTVTQVASTTTVVENLTTIGPYHHPGGVGYAMNVAPGMYTVTVTPAPPFDEYYPPVSAQVPYTNSGDTVRNVQFLTVDNPNDPVPPSTAKPPAATTVTSAQPLDGFVAYLRDQTTHARESSRVPLHGLTTSVQLHTSGQVVDANGTLRNKLEICVTPGPAMVASGVAGVTFADGVIAGAIATTETYPPLPAVVDVEGQVLDANGSPVVAEVALTSTGIARIDRADLDTTTLSYATTFATDASGSYRVMLPPGNYAAIVTPTTSALAAVTATTLDVAPDVAAQRGKTLSVQGTVHLKGTSAVADGRPLAGATIQVKPAAALITAPGTLPAPRPFVGSTNLDGSFDLLVDPGEYDLTVKPAAGSNLPWVVTSSILVPPSIGLTVGLQTIPAPAEKTFTFFNNVQALPNALVHVYATPTGGTVAVEIANGITDSAGQLQLLLAGAPN